jgi:o-succinylbenzoate synthase
MPPPVDMILEWRPYRVPLTSSLATGAGVWQQREGLILRLASADHTPVFAEIAPDPRGTTESLADARAWLQANARSFVDTGLRLPPVSLPATRFALDALRRQWSGWQPAFQLNNTALLDWDEAVAGGCIAAATAGFSTCKIKFDRGPHAVSTADWQRFTASLPPQLQLRLDANGCWTSDHARHWLPRLESIRPQLQFIEQPYPATDAGMAAMAQLLASGWPVAIDESAGSEADWLSCPQRVRWPGWRVIKPAWFGAHQAILAYCAAAPDRCVFSAAFETVVGLRIALALAAESGATLAVGAGTLARLPVPFGIGRCPPVISATDLPAALGSGLWQILDNP